MRKIRILSSRRGNAIIMALVTMTLLLTLGLAVATVSLGTLKTNAADEASNDAYYAAHSAVTSAIEQLKYEVSGYYDSLLEAHDSEYGPLFANFFSGINQNAMMHFSEPVFEGVTTHTTFATGSFDETENVCEFLISSTATAAHGANYRVDGAVYVKKVDVSATGGVWLEIDDAALKAGGTLYLDKKNGTVVSGGNIVVSGISYRRSSLPYSISGGQLIISPDVAETINDCLTYPSYADPVMSDDDLYLTTETTVNWANVPAAPAGITTAEGIALHIANCTVPEGVVYGRGDVHINNCTVYSDVYCDGDLHVNNQSLYGDIYCRGDVDINNATVYGNVYCDGSVALHNGSLQGCVFAGGTINMHDATMSGSLCGMRDVTVTKTSIQGGIVYSHTKLYVGNMSATAVFFSGGDIELTDSMSVTGAMIAKNDIYFSTDSNKNLSVSYSHSVIESIISNENNAAMFSSSGREPELNEDVFIDESITAQGRQQ